MLLLFVFINAFCQRGNPRTIGYKTSGSSHRDLFNQTEYLFSGGRALDGAPGDNGFPGSPGYSGAKGAPGEGGRPGIMGERHRPTQQQPN